MCTSGGLGAGSHRACKAVYFQVHLNRKAVCAGHGSSLCRHLSPSNAADRFGDGRGDLYKSYQEKSEVIRDHIRI